jgi:hypothetical protein
MLVVDGETEEYILPVYIGLMPTPQDVMHYVKLVGSKNFHAH